MLLLSREGSLFSSCAYRMVDDHHFGSFRDCVKSRQGCSLDEDGLPRTHPWPPEVSAQSLIYSVGRTLPLVGPELTFWSHERAMKLCSSFQRFPLKFFICCPVLSRIW